MIKSIELMNWKSHLASKLEFSSGVNGLIGIMGSGKSSITDAICFGLFGTFPKLQQRKVKLEDIVMKKPVDSKRSEIIVEFDSNGKTYKVKRVIDTDKRGGSSAEIMEDGKNIDANPKHVTEMVEQILKTDYELFSRAVYSEQNQLDYFLTVPKSERKKKIDELIRINKFETARAGANTVSNRLENLKDSKSLIIESLKNLADEKRISDMDDEIKNIEKNIFTMTAEAEFLESTRVPKLYDRILEAEDCKKSYENVLSESNSNNAAIEKTMEHLEKVKSRILGKDADDIRKEISAVSKEIEELDRMLRNDRESVNRASKIVFECEAKVNSMKNYASDADSRIKQKEAYEKELKEIESSFSDIEGILESQKNEYEKKIGMSKSLQAKIGEIGESMEKIKNVGDKCPVCDSDISEERKNKIISDRAAMLEELQDSFDACKSGMEKMKSELSEIERFWRRSITLREGVKDLEKLRNDLRESGEIIDALAKTGSEEKSNLEKLSESAKKFESEIERKKSHYHNLNSILEWAAEYESLQSELRKMMEDATRISERLKRSAEKIEGVDIESMRKDFNEASGLKRELIAKINAAAGVCADKKKALEDAKSKLELLEKTRGEIKKIGEVTDDLEIFSAALERTQIALRENFVEAVNVVMSEVWDQLYPYGDFSEVKLNIDDSDYVLQLKERSGRWVDADAASGGERSIACLALRIAFSLALAPNLKWLVLDEPTHNLDSKAVEDLANTLRYGVSDVVEQVFLITHDEKLEDAITGTLYRLERNKANDGATRVVKLD